jgi:hypothetical protein
MLHSFSEGETLLLNRNTRTLNGHFFAKGDRVRVARVQRVNGREVVTVTNEAGHELLSLKPSKLFLRPSFSER